MPKFSLQMLVTERTTQRIEIEAESLADAIHLVQEYNFDNSECQFVESHEWSVDDVRPEEIG